MCDIKENILKLREELPAGVQLVAVSKYHPEEEIEVAYAAGQRIFGENHVQELRRKQPLLPSDIKWHFLGHLQTNKVKYIAPYISVIESVDSERLIEEINRQALRNNRVIDILLELHVAREETKSGLTIDECTQLLESGIKERYENIRICGLMTMASNTDDEALIESEFKTADNYFNYVKSTYFPNDSYFCEKSWGMSGDYKIAIRQNATLVRIGTMIFGPRIY